jgi:hypothetical protein
MSDGTASNVRVGVVGGIFTGPIAPSLGSPCYPTSQVAAIASTLTSTIVAAGMRGSGYVSTDGLTQTIDSTTSKIVAWGGDVVRIVQTEHSVTYSYTVIETNEATLKDYYGEDATSTEVKITSDQLPHRSRVFAVRDGNKRIIVVLPDSQVIERGDIVYAGEDPVGYNVTVEALPDAAGVKAYLYMGDITYTSPTVDTLTPATGPKAGSTLVEIAGTGFLDVRGVKFGDKDALAFKVNSPTSITAFAPSVTAASSVPVSVEAAGGAGTTAAYAYTTA